jgi:tight adherence protein B
MTMTQPQLLLRGLGAAVAALALAAGPAASAWAAPAADETGTISHVEPAPGSLKILVSVPAGAEVDLDGVEVTLDDTEVDATAEPADTTVRRTTVMVIDTSNSMKGERFEAAKLAATEFINTVPDDVYVGIVSFDSQVETALEPSLDRAAAQGVIDGLALERDTRLYDGVVQGVDVAGVEGQRNLLVLSDGADTSDTPITDATTAITEGEMLVDVVALEQSGPDLAALQQLAEAGQGRVISSDPEALRAAFAAEADVLASQVLVTADVPSSFDAAEATVTVTLPTAGGSVTAEAFTDVEPAEANLVRGTDWAPPSWVLYVGPIALGVGLIIVVFVVVPRGDKTMSAEDRVSRYTASQTQSPDSGLLGDTDVTFASAKETAASVLRRNKDLDARISRQLEGAGSELKSSEWLLLHGGIFFVSGLLGIAIGQNLIVGALFMVVGLFGPWLYLSFRRSRRRKAFNSGLPDTLQLMSGSLAAGLSLAQSVDTIVREGADPISGEFRRVLVETRLGVSLEDALEGVAERFDSKDFEWVVMAIKIQRQVGGNLAELLDTVAATMREREYVRRQVAALAAEGKLSAWVLGLLPPLFMVYLLLTNYDYVIVMFQEPLGWLMLGGAATILAVGVFWMSRLVKVEV